MDDARIGQLEDFVNELLRWKTEVNLHEQPKRILPKGTLEGFIFTSRNFVFLCERLLQQLDYVCLRTFSQDLLEAFFGNLVCARFRIVFQIFQPKPQYISEELR